MRTILTAASFMILATSASAFADTVAFIGPAGWSHNPPTASTDTSRVVDQWHIAGDISSVVFIKDSTTAYADALAAVQKNVTTNGIKTSVDKDMQCRGTTSHVVEFAFGPDGHRVVMNRLLVPDGTGVDTITYARADGSAFDADVKTSETAFCAGT